MRATVSVSRSSSFNNKKSSGYGVERSVVDNPYSRFFVNYSKGFKGLLKSDFDELIDQLFLEYDVIMADPPWHFENYLADAPGMLHDRSRGANRYYPTATTDDICKLVPPAADNAVLFLWRFNY